MTHKPAGASANQDSPQKDEARRGFLQRALATVIGAVVVLFPVGAGLAVFLDPLRRKTGGGRLVRIAPLDMLPADGIPRIFPVVADRVDAWNYFPATRIGSVFLRRTSETDVTAVNAACPHAGCFVDFRVNENKYQCPCHDSQFQPDGKRIDPAHCPAPRDLDSLTVDAERLKQGEIWVDFENFLAGKQEKIPEA